MRNKQKTVIQLSVLLLVLLFASSLVAGPHGDSGKAKKSSKGHNFSGHWAKTLTDEQKVSVDKMHLLVDQVEVVQRAKMKMLKAELNVIAAKGSSSNKALYAKIDEMLAVKKIIMRTRYDHIVEMRAELTEQQRISYDAGQLKHKGH